MDTFGNRLKSLRKSKSLTQEELASIFYINKSSISRYENNSQIPEHKLLQKIADFFDVSLDYLLGRTDEENSNIATYNIIKKDTIDHNTFMEYAKFLFMNGSLDEEVLEKIYRDIGELYWEAKEINKKK